MRTEARFPEVGPGAGHYESFYIKATRPGGGAGIWIRHTVHQRPDEPRTASIWFTVFDAERPGPVATKVTVGADELSAPTGAYIKVADALLEPGRARGEISTDAFTASWELEFSSADAGVPPPPLRLSLPRAAAEDEVPLPVSERALQRHGHGRRRAPRARRLARE